jgi:hypothetical protein
MGITLSQSCNRAIGRRFVNLISGGFGPELNDGFLNARWELMKNRCGSVPLLAEITRSLDHRITWLGKRATSHT